LESIAIKENHFARCDSNTEGLGSGLKNQVVQNLRLALARPVGMGGREIRWWRSFDDFLKRINGFLSVSIG